MIFELEYIDERGNIINYSIDTDKLSTIKKVYEYLFKDINNNLESAEHFRLFNNHMDKVFNYLFFIPGSTSHHDNRPFGALEHTMEVLAETYKSTVTKSSENMKERGRRNYTMFVAALYHDTGKMFGYKIFRLPHKGYKSTENVAVWKFDTPLTEFCKEPGHYVMRPRPIGMYHNVMSNYFFCRNFPLPEVLYIGEIFFNQAIATFLNRNARINEVYKADVEVVRQSVQKMEKPEDLPHIRMFFHFLREAITVSKILPNTTGRGTHSVFYNGHLLYIVWPMVLWEICRLFKGQHQFPPYENMLQNLMDAGFVLKENNLALYDLTIIIKSLKVNTHLPAIIINERSLEINGVKEFFDQYIADPDDVKLIHKIKTLDQIEQEKKMYATEKAVKAQSQAQKVKSDFEKLKEKLQGNMNKKAANNV